MIDAEMAADILMQFKDGCYKFVARIADGTLYDVIFEGGLKAWILQATAAGTDVVCGRFVSYDVVSIELHHELPHIFKVDKISVDVGRARIVFELVC